MIAPFRPCPPMARYVATPRPRPPIRAMATPRRPRRPRLALSDWLITALILTLAILLIL